MRVAMTPAVGLPALAVLPARRSAARGTMRPGVVSRSRPDHRRPVMARRAAFRVCSVGSASSASDWPSPPPPGGNGGKGGGGGGGSGPGDGSSEGGDDGRRRADRQLVWGGLIAAATAAFANPAFAKAVAKAVPAAKPAEHEDEPTFTEKLEVFVECLIFSCRFLVLIAVFGTVGMSGLMFAKGAQTLQKALAALMAGAGSEVTMRAIGSLDDFLTGCASLVFGMGLYELFISKLDPAGSDEDDEEGAPHKKKKRGGFSLDHRPNWLHVDSLQHLEHNTGAVVVMVMCVNIFENSKKIKPTEPLQLVYMGAATLLCAVAIFIMGIPERDEEAEEPHKAHAAEKKGALPAGKK